MPNVYFKFGTQAKYDALEKKDSNSLYWIEDSQRLYKGDELYAAGKVATQEADGLFAAVDKVALDSLVSNAITGLTAVDASVVVSGSGNSRIIGVAVSADEGNQLALHTDGLFVPSPAEVTVPEYTIERQAESTDDYSAVYWLKKTLDGTSTYVGDPINIPKDLVVESGELKTVEVDDEPYIGARVWDRYIDLVLNDSDETNIYIPVNDLVDVYTAGNGIVIDNGEIGIKIDNDGANGLSVGTNGLALAEATESVAGALSATDKQYINKLPSLLENKTTQNLVGANGKAIIWNESDGGGVKFEHNDGTWSFVGVNDGGENGITGQIYSVKKTDGKYVGTRLNMTSDGFYYLPNSNSSAYVEENEIATKGDIIDAALAWEEM